MSWVSEQQQTRSGTVFSPFTPVPALTPISILMNHAFDFAVALIKPVVLEREGADEDHEDSDEDSDDSDNTAVDSLDGHIPPLAARPNRVNDAFLPPIPDSRPNRVNNTSLPPIPDCVPPPSFECTPGVDGIAPSSPDDVDNFVVPLPAAPDPWTTPDPWNDVDDASPHPTPDHEPSPPLKRARTALDDMHAGKKPQTHSHRNRAAKRARKIEKEGHAPHTSTLRKHVRAPLATALRVMIDAITFPATHRAYAAKELVRMGFDVVKWNGYDSRPLVDAHGRIFAVLVGQPQGMAAAFPAAMRWHRRGLFAVINVSLSYGKGQTVPSALYVDPQYAGIVERLLGSRPSSAWRPSRALPLRCGRPASTNTTASMTRHSTPIYPASPQLQTLVFSCAAFNFGPHVWTFAIGHAERPIRLVPVQSASEFDATRSGHLVLWDLKLAVEFLHGALILLPSATITHSNIPVHLRRHARLFTQFTLAEEDEAEFARMAEAKVADWMGATTHIPLQNTAANTGMNSADDSDNESQEGSSKGNEDDEDNEDEWEDEDDNTRSPSAPRTAATTSAAPTTGVVKSTTSFAAPLSFFAPASSLFTAPPSFFAPPSGTVIKIAYAPDQK
ncbi:hypothetical protein B0H17DRAFT_1217865 [Mycena rosella]|uniref:Uncharacterized protein n=1 Tax=Mycena rosella TaxID=1033263 RepID=A0AAD7FPU1_MYCRO|nr:hypothetical protein B0H17DRAFT_1217865 [Mycena rosella]